MSQLSLKPSTALTARVRPPHIPIDLCPLPEYAQATKQAKLAQQALTIAEYNRKSLRTSFAQGYSSIVLTDARQKYDPDR